MLATLGIQLDNLQIKFANLNNNNHVYTTLLYSNHEFAIVNNDDDVVDNIVGL